MTSPTSLKPKKEFTVAHWKMVRNAVVLIALGLLVSAGAVALERYFHHGNPATELSWGVTTLITVVDHLGLGIISAAVLGFVMELSHMQKYFQHLIEKTIIKREFIKTLASDEKEAMQKQSLEAYFGVSELGKEGDFYDFYVKKLRKHIGGPFRQGARFKTVVEPGPDDRLFTVTDTISYICRRGAEGIQNDVRWTAEQDEAREVLRLIITTTKPDQTTQTYALDKASSERHPSLVPNDKGHGCKLLLDEYKNCDGLAIKVEVTYVVSRERPFSWTMPFLSHGFSGEIYFPDDLDMFVDLFGMSKRALPKDKSKLPKIGNFNYYEIAHKDWLLPDDGFSFYFTRKQPSASPAPPVQMADSAYSPVH